MFVITVVVGVLSVVAGLAWLPAGIMIPVGYGTALVLGSAISQRHVVGPPAWRYCGVAITGEALRMLVDIQGRFRYAESLVRQVPTGIDSNKVRHDVEMLMWEAAGHAARASALEQEMAGLRYASSGTPQAALKEELRRRREEYVGALEGVREEAEALGRAAGNAAAAARIALERTGSLAALEVVAPTAQGVLLVPASPRHERGSNCWPTCGPRSTSRRSS